MPRALGRCFDIGSVVVPVADLAAGAQTGHRVHLKNAGGVAFVVFMGEANAATGGTLQNLAAITTWYDKNETTLDGDETWNKTTQAAAATVSLTGATYAAVQMIVVIEVLASQLSDGFEWVTLDMPDPGAGGTRAGGFLAILFDLEVQRTPPNLAQLNA